MTPQCLHKDTYHLHGNALQQELARVTAERDWLLETLASMAVEINKDTSRMSKMPKRLRIAFFQRAAIWFFISQGTNEAKAHR